jgi:hypothetical protein
MKYKINDFILVTGKRQETLEEQIAVPTEISYGKAQNYGWKHKTREFTVFEQLNLFQKDEEKYYQVINDLFDFIDFVEILKFFVNNKLDTSKTYQIGNSFTANVIPKDDTIKLKIHFTGWEYSMHFDKFESSSYIAKFSKALQRCELWQE